MTIEESGSRYEVHNWHLSLTPVELKRLVKGGCLREWRGDGSKFTVTVRKPRKARPPQGEDA